MVALVPVKRLDQAKSRLAPILAPAERASLMLACLDVVLDALQGSGVVERVVVVSPTPEVLHRATRAGAFGLDERALGVADDQNAALEAARDVILNRGRSHGVEARSGRAASPDRIEPRPHEMASFPSSPSGVLARAGSIAIKGEATSLLVVSADLPRLHRDDVRGLVALGRDERAVVIAPDHRGEGTNALYQRPAGLIRFAFGPGSRARHAALAARVGARARYYHQTGTALDVDEATDLEWIGIEAR